MRPDTITHTGQCGEERMTMERMVGYVVVKLGEIPYSTSAIFVLCHGVLKAFTIFLKSGEITCILSVVNAASQGF